MSKRSKQPVKRTLYLDELYDQHTFIDRAIFDVEFLNIKASLFTTTPVSNVYYIQHMVTDGELFTFSWLPNSINCCRKLDFEIKLTLDRLGVNTPNMFYSHNISRAATLIKNKNYLLKYLGHARSLGQCVVDVEKIIAMKNDTDLEVDDFNKKYDVSLGKMINNDEKSLLLDSLEKGRVFLQEMVDVVSEYRVLMFLDKDNKYKYITEYREGYGPNSEVERKHEVIDISERRIFITDKDHSAICKTKLLDKLYEVLVDQNVPALSFDVYFDKDGNWGLFEFCTQFGVEYSGYYNELTEYYTNAITVMCDKIDERLTRI